MGVRLPIRHVDGDPVRHGVALRQRGDRPPDDSRSALRGDRGAPRARLAAARSSTRPPSGCSPGAGLAVRRGPGPHPRHVGHCRRTGRRGRTGQHWSADTKNAGTKTTVDTVRIGNNTAAVTRYDDLYIKTGDGEAFNGPISVDDDGTIRTVVSDSIHRVRVAYKPGEGHAAIRFRAEGIPEAVVSDSIHRVRVARTSPASTTFHLGAEGIPEAVVSDSIHRAGAAYQRAGTPDEINDRRLNARHTTRVATTLPPSTLARLAVRVSAKHDERTLARQTTRVAAKRDAVTLARQSLRVAFSSRVWVRRWTGTQWVLQLLLRWNGTTFGDAEDAYTWNGSEWVPAP